MLNRILIALPITLVILMLVVVFYLFFYKPAPQAMVVTTGEESTGSQQAVLSSNVLNYLSATGDILVSSKVTNEFSGVLTEVLDRPGVRKFIVYEKALGLRSVGEGSGGTNYLLFRKNDVGAIKVYEPFLGVNKQMEFADLKVGDRVKIKEIIDLLADPSYNRLEIEITKL
jgi:hypothetical protein